MNIHATPQIKNTHEDSINADESISNFLHHSLNKCLIFSCDTQFESKVEKIYEILNDGMKWQEKYAMLTSQGCYRLNKFNGTNIILDRYFGNIAENDHILFAITYKGESQKELIKNLIRKSKNLPYFKIAIIIDSCEKDAIEAIKACLPSNNPDFTLVSY